MATIAHRLRCIASIAGAERLRAFDQLLRTSPSLARPLIEGTDPMAIAEAQVHILDALGVETAAHSWRMAARMRLLGRRMGLAEDEVVECALGALCHDVGKISVPDAILHAPRILDPRELDLIKMHSSLGHAVLFGLPGLTGAASMVLAHHEYWDGSGYPNGLRGQSIPLAARMFTIVDSYDAMVRIDREFRVGVSHRAACEEIRALTGKKYDPEIAEVFHQVSEGPWLDIGWAYPDVPLTDADDASDGDAADAGGATPGATIASLGEIAVFTPRAA